MGFSPHLCFFLHAKQRVYDQTYKFVWGPALICFFFHAKQRVYDQTYKFVWGPDLICGFCMQYSVISTRNTCLYGSQPLSVVFACITATFGSEYKFSKGTRPHLSFLHAKQRLLVQNNKSLWVPDMIYRFVHVQQRA